MNRVLPTISFSLVLLCLLGCGGNDDGYQVTPVKGRVTLNGDPLADAEIAFHFQGEAPEGYTGAFGKTNADGQYELLTDVRTGCLPGEHKVTVNKTVQADDPQPPVPDKYASVDSTDITKTVTVEKSDGYDIELTGE